MTATPNSADVITPELPLRQSPRRLLRASSTTASALSAASASSFRSYAADLAGRAPISPSGIRVRHRDHNAEFRRRHHVHAFAPPTCTWISLLLLSKRVGAAAPPTTAPAPLSQLDDGEHAQRRERVVLPIARPADHVVRGRSRRRESACVVVTATPNSAGVITPELPLRQSPRRLP